MANLIQRFLDWGEGWFGYHARQWYWKHHRIRASTAKENRIASILGNDGLSVKDAAALIQERLNG